MLSPPLPQLGPLEFITVLFFVVFALNEGRKVKREEEGNKINGDSN